MKNVTVLLVIVLCHLTHCQLQFGLGFGLGNQQQNDGSSNFNGQNVGQRQNFGQFGQFFQPQGGFYFPNQNGFYQQQNQRPNQNNQNNQNRPNRPNQNQNQRPTQPIPVTQRSTSRPVPPTAAPVLTGRISETSKF